MDAYLILSRAGGFSGLSSGETAMVSPVGEVGHASLYIRCGIEERIAEDGHANDIYLSFYPHRGGLYSGGSFIRPRREGLFNIHKPHTIVYKISGLDERALLVYVKSLSEAVQRRRARETGMIWEPPIPRAAVIAGRTTPEDTRELGYDGFRHNCSHVCLNALRAGGFSVRIPWYSLTTPSSIDLAIRAHPASNCQLIPIRQFQTEVLSRWMDIPNLAFRFRPGAAIEAHPTDRDAPRHLDSHSLRNELITDRAVETASSSPSTSSPTSSSPTLRVEAPPRPTPAPGVESRADPSRLPLAEGFSVHNPLHAVVHGTGRDQRGRDRDEGEGESSPHPHS